MSEPKWTPGPWSYGFPTAETALGKNDYEDWGTIRDAEGWPLARVNSSRFDEAELAAFRKRREDPVAAEALLIAAAPELAEALEECRVACCEIAVGAQAAGYDRTSLIGAAWSFEFAARRLLDAAAKADAALAKAKGEVE